jgi:20S proteasome subunit beta 6
MIKKLPTSQEEVQNTARDILNSIAERDIYTGDGIEMITVDSTGVKIQNFPLRRD